MGNAVISFINKHPTMTIDEIAAEYILNMNSRHIKQLNNWKECNKLIDALAADIKTKYSEQYITKVSKRIESTDENRYIGVAKFYVKVAHVFASIIKTQPTKDSDKDATSLCGSRLFSLMNMSSKKDISYQGMPELDTLYNDSKYDFESGEFKGRSALMNQEFNDNLATFYKAFTGSSVMDPNIKKFSDIKLKTYTPTPRVEEPLCKNNTCDDSVLFEQYALNIANNMTYMHYAYKTLNLLLDTLFSHKNDHLCINEELTESILADIVIEARGLIIDLYVECEENYNKGVQIYEAIANKKILNTLHKQVKELTKHRIELTPK